MSALASARRRLRVSTETPSDPPNDRVLRWHRPLALFLLLLAVIAVGSAVASLVGDDRFSGIMIVLAAVRVAGAAGGDRDAGTAVRHRSLAWCALILACPALPFVIAAVDGSDPLSPTGLAALALGAAVGLVGFALVTRLPAVAPQDPGD